MSINCINKEALEAFMRENLTEKRYIHSLGVQKMAIHLAALHGADTEKAGFAGRYHDIAKCMDKETSDRYVRKYNLPDEYIGNPALAHSKIAAELLRCEYGVDDEDVLNAVRSHTTGRAGMSLLEEIVYVADAIEDNRNYPELKNLQLMAETDLDGVCLIIMEFALEMLKKKGKAADAATLEAEKWIRERIGNKQN